jgi:hypothetical protein
VQLQLTFTYTIQLGRNTRGLKSLQTAPTPTLTNRHLHHTLSLNIHCMFLVSGVTRMQHYHLICLGLLPDLLAWESSLLTLISILRSACSSPMLHGYSKEGDVSVSDTHWIGRYGYLDTPF